MEWNKTYGGTGGDGAYSLAETSDGGYALAGYTYVSFSLDADGDDDVWLLKTDENRVVPEASWVILPLLLTATLAIFINKKKLFHPRS
jgi:hypothetical protein